MVIPKQVPTIITYRNYKHFDKAIFRQEFLDILCNVNSGTIVYDTFVTVCIELLKRHAPLKEKYLRANNQPFMNKSLSKAVMTRTRLRNKFLKNPCENNKAKYPKYRNYCTSPFRKEKKNTTITLTSNHLLTIKNSGSLRNHYSLISILPPIKLHY